MIVTKNAIEQNGTQKKSMLELANRLAGDKGYSTASNLYRAALVLRIREGESPRIAQMLREAVGEGVRIGQNETMTQNILLTYFNTSLEKLGVEFKTVARQNAIYTLPSAEADPHHYNAMLIGEIDEAKMMAVANKGVYC